jgi:hypothetical protein
MAKAGRIADIICCIAAIAAAAAGTWVLQGQRETICQARGDKLKRDEYWVGGVDVSDEIEIQGLSFSSTRK